MGERGPGQTTGLQRDPLLQPCNSGHDEGSAQSPCCMCPASSACRQPGGKRFPLELKSHHNPAVSYSCITAPCCPRSVGAEAAHDCLRAGCEMSQDLWADVWDLSALLHHISQCHNLCQSVPQPVPPAKPTQSAIKSNMVNKKQAQAEEGITLKKGTGLGHIKILIYDLAWNFSCQD